VQPPLPAPVTAWALAFWNTGGGPGKQGPRARQTMGRDGKVGKGGKGTKAQGTVDVCQGSPLQLAGRWFVEAKIGLAVASCACTVPRRLTAPRGCQGHTATRQHADATSTATLPAAPPLLTSSHRCAR
jgi:hypothetical protein